VPQPQPGTFSLLHVVGDIDLRSLRPRSAIVLQNSPGKAGAVVTSQGPGKQPIWGTGGAATSGSLPTASLASGTAHQFDAVYGRHVVTSVTFTPTAGATATCTVALSADDVTFSTLWVETVPVGVALDGFVRGIAVYVPAGWWLKLTTNAQASIGTTTYY
jgi:hypothetical protein